jgi:SpoVK/Ycf46/Vps4 family AAA+-type ATPase
MQLLESFIGKIPFEESPTSETRMLILARLSVATEGKSGRELKSLVARASMKALQRTAKTGGSRQINLREADFEVTAQLW